MAHVQSEEQRQADLRLRASLRSLKTAQGLTKGQIASQWHRVEGNLPRYMDDLHVGSAGSLRAFKELIDVLDPGKTEHDKLLKLYSFAHGVELPPQPKPQDDGFYSRDEVSALVGSVKERIDGAVTELVITGNDCLAAVQGSSSNVRRALDRCVKVKILGVSPETPGIVEMLQHVDPRFPEVGNLRISIAALSETLQSWCASKPDRAEYLEYKLLPVVPALGFFMADPDRDGPVKCEIYTPQDPDSADSGFDTIPSRPHFVPQGRWRPYYIEMFRRYWNMAQSVPLASDTRGGDSQLGPATSQ